MEYAKSMLLGGDIIFAKDCDYNSAKELALVCPLCSEAVFFTAGSLRSNLLRNKTRKVQKVRASFHHYKTGIYEPDCENRIKTKEGQRQINSLIIEAKGQRLELYNQHLWELIRRDRNIRPKRLNRHIKAFIPPHIKDWISSLSIATRKYWRQTFLNSDEFKEELTMLQAHQHNLENSSNDILYNLGKTSSDNPFSISQNSWNEEINKGIQYRNHFSMRYHEAIAREIFDFLGTKTSGHLWLWLTKAAINMMVQFSYGTDLSYLMISKSDDLYRKVCQMIVSLIYGCHWAKIMKEKLNLI